MNGKSLCVVCWVAACLGASAGCEQSSPPPSSSAPVATPTAPEPPVAAPAPVATAPALKLEAVPAREDFEEEAETQITPANLEKQLEALEKEIAAE